MKKICKNCKWRHGIYLFECHRFPKQSTGRKVKETYGGTTMKVPEFRYPSVKNDDFCGEFKPNKK